jgi:hypothetical protein
VVRHTASEAVATARVYVAVCSTTPTVNMLLHWCANRVVYVLGLFEVGCPVTMMTFFHAETAVSGWSFWQPLAQSRLDHAYQFRLYFRPSVYAVEACSAHGPRIHAEVLVLGGHAFQWAYAGRAHGVER